MEQPKILGANMFACALTTGGGFAVLAAALKTGGMVAVAALCNAPAVGTVLAAGFVA